MREDFCGSVVAINIVSKSLNYGSYADYTQYDSISKLYTAHANVYGLLVEGAMNSRCIGKDNRAVSIFKSVTRLECL